MLGCLVQLGFFVENASGTIYSSYQSPELKDGLLELVPGEVKTIRLRQPFPGITQDGNVLWFDVRSAGQPGKQLFRTRLICLCYKHPITYKRCQSMNLVPVIVPLHF